MGKKTPKTKSKTVKSQLDANNNVQADKPVSYSHVEKESFPMTMQSCEKMYP